MPLFLCHFEITLDLQRRIFRVTGLLKYRYFVTLSIYDCFMLMKRFKEKNAIIINPNRDNSLVIDNILIKYLKNGG